MKRLIILLLLLLFIVTSSVAQSEPPYLYYYSRMLGGIIIERADGTDSRIIGHDVIPAGLTGIAGPGWSPSGKYFAGMTIYWFRDNYFRGKAFLIDEQGDTFNEQWEKRFGATHFIEWSNGAKDWLLVPGAEEQGSEYTIGLIDAQSGNLLSIYNSGFNYYQNGLDISISETDWETIPNGVQFYILEHESQPNEYFRITLLEDGTVLKEASTEEAFTIHPLLVPRDYSFNVTSPSGKYQINREPQKELLEVETGEVIELPSHGSATFSSCRSGRWNTSEDYIITLEGTAVAGGGCGSAAIGVVDRSVNLWRELAYCTWDENCVNWLPLQVDVNALPSGQSTPVQLDPIAFEVAQNYSEGSLYDLTDTRLRCSQASSRDEPNRVIEDGDGEILYSLYSSKPCSYSYYYGKTEDGIYIVEAYDSVNDLLATVVEWGQKEGVWIWSFEDGVGKQINQLNTSAYMLEFTKDGKYLRVRDLNQWKIYSVEDILRTAKIEN